MIDDQATSISTWGPSPAPRLVLVVQLGHRRGHRVVLLGGRHRHESPIGPLYGRSGARREPPDGAGEPRRSRGPPGSPRRPVAAQAGSRGRGDRRGARPPRMVRLPDQHMDARRGRRRPLRGVGPVRRADRPLLDHLRSTTSGGRWPSARTWSPPSSRPWSAGPPASGRPDPAPEPATGAGPALERRAHRACSSSSWWGPPCCPARLGGGLAQRRANPSSHVQPEVSVVEQAAQRLTRGQNPYCPRHAQRPRASGSRPARPTSPSSRTCRS